MDFLAENRAAVDLESRHITLSTDQATQSKTILGHHDVLSILYEEVCVPPRSSVMIPVVKDNTEDVEGAIEGNMHFLLDRELGVASGMASFKNGQSYVLVTIFGKEHGHLNKGTMIAFLDEEGDIQDTFSISDQSAQDLSMHNHSHLRLTLILSYPVTDKIESTIS